jgi:hypothetical protein
MGITTENLTLIDICPEGAVSTLPLRGGGRGGGAFFSAEAERLRLVLGEESVRAHSG